MRTTGPMALLAAAVALAVVGVGLLLPSGRPEGQRGVRDTAAGSTTVGSAGIPAVATPDAPLTAPTSNPSALSPSASVTATAGSPTAPASPADRLAGPVADEEVAQAFAAAVPAAPDVDAELSQVLVRTAADGLARWHGEAGWRDVRVQAAVVTNADGPSATVSALWSGAHPVLGDSDRRLATVSLTAAPGPGPAWTIHAIEGGSAHG